MNTPITPWFEDSEFMSQLLALGLSEALKHGSENTKGLMLYFTDEQYVEDGRLIAELVKLHNQKI